MPIAEVLERAGYREIPLAEVPGTDYASAAARKMPLPSPGMLDRARGVMHYNDSDQVKVCRGSEKGCDGRDDQMACRDCYAVYWHDKRPSAEILEAIKRGDA